MPSMSIRRTITDGKHMLRHASTRPAHPGKLLREIVIPATNLSKSEVALLLGISRQHLKSMIRFAQCRTENRFPPRIECPGQAFPDIAL
jgi:hypothetical protein